MKKKLKNIFRNNLAIILTFLSALIIILCIFYLQKVAPFGNNSLLTIDFFHQYGPMLSELADRIKNGANLIYSFSMGMGLPLFRNFFNYLSSPFNIIILLFKHQDILVSYSVVIGLKAIISSCTMFYYLKKKFNNNFLYFIPISLLYGFCAYFTAYYWNIMWLDGMVFLPLITLGIENIINKNRPLLYIISLCIMLFANYFIAYMICFFSVIYFLAYLIIKNDHFNIKTILKKCLIFGFSSLLVGFLCTWFLIPMANSLGTISATSDSWPFSQYYAFTFKELLFNHLSGVGSTVLKSGTTVAPNVSCGVLCFTLLLLFIVNPNIKLKTKIVYLSLLAFFMLSFFFAPLDFIWHAFHVPNDLPYRYSFIYSFVLCIISAYSIINIKHLKPLVIWIVYIIMMMFVGSLYIFNFSNINDDMILLNLVLLTIYLLCYILFRYFYKQTNILPYLLIATTILECIICVNNNWNISQSIPTFYNDYNDVEEAVSYIKNNDEEKFYRIDRTYILSFNDPSWYGYYGQTTFSSMAYLKMAVLQNKFGLPGNEINSYYFRNTTPVYNTLFDIKYFMGDNKNTKNYTNYYTNKSVNVYKNNYTVGLMFGVNSNIVDWKYKTGNPFEIQNDFIEKAGNEKVFSRITNVKKEKVYNENDGVIVKYTVDNPDDMMYFYYNSSNIDFILLDDTLYYTTDSYNYINNLKIKLYIFNYEDYNEKYVINTETNNKEYTFYVGYNNYYSDNYMIYKMDNDKYINFFNNINNNKVYITDFKENNIKGNINSINEQVIYTSIPYDEGWEVYIDGKKVNTFSLGDALLAFNISKGKHNIELKYNIPNIKVYVLLSVVSLIILAFLIINKKRF